jgi:Ni/Co efflux regulator RcnB
MSQPKYKHAPLWTALGLSLMLGTAPAFAEKPSWAGGGGDKHGQDERPGKSRNDRGGNDRDDRGRGDDGRRDGRDDRRRDGGSLEIRFGGGDRDLIRDYYGNSIRSKGCPPGLAKKHNGCLPPGQAKQWQRGARLPGGVVIYDLPRDLSIRLGTPPAGHRYVRVASDILLITVGTSMVVDAIEDLGGL